MKKVLSIVLAVFIMAMSVSAFAEATKVKIAATPVPHAEILEFIKPMMLEKGFDIEVIIYNDYVQPNLVVDRGEMEANYFQHVNYLTNFNAEQGTKLVAVIPVHFEPMGVYKGKTQSLEELKDGATIGVPNDVTNEARALLLLETLGLIELNPDAGVKATKLDIAKNEKNLQFVEIEAAQLPRMLMDFDFAVINGNYAMDAGLSLIDDTVGAEGADALVYAQSVNYIVVKEGDEEAPFVVALREALSDPSTIEFMLETYQGSMVLADELTQGAEAVVAQ